MPRPRQLDPAALTLRLQSGGPTTAQTMAAAAGVDRSRVSRALAGLGSSIVRLGTTRGAHYALRRSVRGAGHTFPVRRLDEEGRAHDWAEVTALHGGWRVAWAEADRAPAWADRVLGLGGWSEGFPFFLSDLRPQGYLGRLLGRGLPPALGLPADPRDWSDDDTLIFLQAEGENLPGDLVVGDAVLQRVQRNLLAPATAIAEADRASHYPERAAGMNESGTGGSSVEGEQPKFLVTLETAAGCRAVLVKFTDVRSGPTGRRWADLLVAEAIALEILRDHGEAQAVPRVVDAGGRRFLEIERFDRVGNCGRRGVVSLRALHDTFPGTETSDWTARAAELAAAEIISEPALRSIRLRQTFGRLIGNSDMHFGNLAFWRDDTLPFRLAPAYDMLPMAWAPVPGQAEPTPEFDPPLPLPSERGLWGEAAVWATDFWERVGADERVSPEFAAIARAAAEVVAHRRRHFSA